MSTFNNNQNDRDLVLHKNNNRNSRGQLVRTAASTGNHSAQHRSRNPVHGKRNYPTRGGTTVRHSSLSVSLELSITGPNNDNTGQTSFYKAFEQHTETIEDGSQTRRTTQTRSMMAVVEHDRRPLERSRPAKAKAVWDDEPEVWENEPEDKPAARGYGQRRITGPVQGRICDYAHNEHDDDVVTGRVVEAESETEDEPGPVERRWRRADGHAKPPTQRGQRRNDNGNGSGNGRNKAGGQNGRHDGGHDDRHNGRNDANRNNRNGNRNNRNRNSGDADDNNNNNNNKGSNSSNWRAGAPKGY